MSKKDEAISLTERWKMDIYNISFNMADVADKDKWSMNDWYNDLINKTYNQLDLSNHERIFIDKIKRAFDEIS